MTSYRYNSSSLIDRVVFKKSDNGSGRAYLHASTNSSAEDLERITKAVCDEGWYAIPAMYEGKSVLEVRGYLFENSVSDFLQKQNFVHAAPQVEKEAAAQSSFIDKVRGRSLQGTSLFFLGADACYSRYGYLSGRPEDVAAGVAYGIGSATMGLAGTGAQAMHEIQAQTRKLIKYAKEHEIDFSHNLTIPIVTENNKRAVFQRIIDTLQTYPTEIGNSFTALAGALIAYSSYKYRLRPDLKARKTGGHDTWSIIKSAGLKDVGLGVSTVASGMIGGWMKEKNHDPDIPYSDGIKGWWEWIWERPLSVAAAGYMLSTAFHTWSTIQETSEAKVTGDLKSLNAIKWRAGFISCTIIGEALMMISSKGHGEGVKSDVSTEDSIIAIAAEIIAQQKPTMQAELVENISHFLGRQDVLGGKDTNVKERLEQAVQMVQKNPWAQAAMHPAHWQQKVSAVSSSPLSVPR